MTSYQPLSVTIEERRRDVERITEMEGGVYTIRGTIDFAGTGETVTSVSFPVAFVEEPFFTFARQISSSSSALLGSYPTLHAFVVSWNFIIKPDTGLKLYTGASLTITVTGNDDQQVALGYQFKGKALRNPIGLVAPTALSRFFVAGVAGGHDDIDNTSVLAYTDDNGATWSAPRTPIDGWGLQVVAWDGMGTIVIGGGGNATIPNLASSSDGGQTWVRRDNPGTGVTDVYGAAWSPSIQRWIIVTRDAFPTGHNVFSSPDLVTWTAHATDLDVFNMRAFWVATSGTAIVVEGIVESPDFPGFHPAVTVGALARTTDLVSWTYSRLDVDGAPLPHFMNKVRYVNGAFFVTGRVNPDPDPTFDSPGLWRSTDDGITWHKVHHSLVNTGVFDFSLFDIAWDGTNYIIAGNGFATGPNYAPYTGIATSPDLVHWATRSTPLDTQPRDTSYWAVAADPQAVIIGSLGFTQSVVVTSDNHGASFNPRSTGLDYSGVFDAVAVPLGAVR